MKELDELIDLLEAQIPGNPNSPKALKLADALEKDMQKYFKNLNFMLPMQALEQIYYRYVEVE